jgi:hypothetical protein
MSIDGVYSVVASAVAGSSAGAIQISNGVIKGTDIAGAEYHGTATRQLDGSVKMSITMETPPDLFHVWSGTVGDTFQSRTIDLHLPREVFDDGKPYEVPGYGMTVIFRHIPDDFAHLAGTDGRKHMIGTLMKAEEKWKAHRQ